MIAFSFTSDWLRKGHEFSEPITEGIKVKLNQSRIIFSTQMKIALRLKIMSLPTKNTRWWRQRLKFLSGAAHYISLFTHLFPIEFNVCDLFAVLKMNCLWSLTLSTLSRYFPFCPSLQNVVESANSYRGQTLGMLKRINFEDMYANVPVNLHTLKHAISPLQRSHRRIRFTAVFTRIICEYVLQLCLHEY